MTSSEGFQQHLSIISKSVCCGYYMKIKKRKKNLLQSVAKVLYMWFDRFLLAVESRDLSQADKSIIRVSSFPNWVMGSRTSFSVSQQLRPELSAKWIFSILSDLPLTRKNREKCLLFKLANFWMIKLTKTSILPNCQEPNWFFGYNCNLSFKNWSLGKKTLL